jgi:prenyltransferase beta subunit
MINAATGAKNLLTDSADVVVEFITKHANRDGGFKGRTDKSDLYYAVFAIESLLALEADFKAKAVTAYLKKFGDGKKLDFVHLACLARCRADLNMHADADQFNAKIAMRLELYRSADGGYGNSTGGTNGTAYGCFLALGACQDLNVEMVWKQGLIDCIASLKRPDGSYANESTIETGSTPATAAAVTALHYLGIEPDAASAEWLLGRSRATGGFLATPTAPIPDLLSTATAIHALSLTGVSTDDVKQPTLEYLDSLWSTDGAFAGNWMDETLDCEYTYYALLALGHLGGK